MIHIIPAAGPDFIDENNTVKFEKKIRNITLFHHTILSRAWRKDGDCYIFVFYDHAETRRFARELISCFNNIKCMFINHYTNGAADTVLSACGLVEPNSPICVDLGDIIIHDKIGQAEIFSQLKKNDATVLTFESLDPKYSYVKVNKEKIVLAKEKIVISNRASAGVYFFKNRKTLLQSMYECLDDKKYTLEGINFVCPLVNAFSDASEIQVKRTEDIKDLDILN